MGIANHYMSSCFMYIKVTEHMGGHLIKFQKERDKLQMRTAPFIYYLKSQALACGPKTKGQRLFSYNIKNQEEK